MSGLSIVEQEAISRLDHRKMMSQVESWCAINSGTLNLAGVSAMAAHLSDAFAVLPGRIALVDPEMVTSITGDGFARTLVHGRHLHLTVRPEAPIQMLFTGHLDTVFPADHPFQKLTMQKDGILNGPGVADMKSGIAVMLAALEAVESSPLAAGIGYEVVINSDEETGSLSSAGLLARAAAGKVAALTYEPALPDGTLAGARGGSGNFSLVIRGRSAHAGRNPEDGRNAIVAAADLAVRLAHARSPGLSVNPAKIEGGGPNNVVPDLAVLRVNFGPATRSDTRRAVAYLEAEVARVAAEHDVTIDIHGGFNRAPKPIDPGTATLQELVRGAGADLGLDIGWRATGGVCDGNNIAACGVPVVDTMGARGGAIHSPDEFLVVDSLVERAALSVLTVMRIAQNRFP